MNSNDVLVKIVVTLRRFLDRRNLYDDPKSLLAIKPSPTWQSYVAKLRRNQNVMAEISPTHFNL